MEYWFEVMLRSTCIPPVFAFLDRDQHRGEISGTSRRGSSPDVGSIQEVEHKERPHAWLPRQSRYPWCRVGRSGRQTYQDTSVEFP